MLGNLIALSIASVLPKLTIRYKHSINGLLVTYKVFVFVCLLSLLNLLYFFCNRSDSSYKHNNLFKHSNKCFLFITGSKISTDSSHNLKQNYAKNFKTC